MKLHVEDKNGCLVVTINGELDHHTAGDIREKIDKAYDRTSCKDLVFDLKGVEFMDSSGIGMIIGRYRNAEKRGGQVFVTEMSAGIQKIFALSGLQKIIKSCATMKDFEKERLLLHGKGDGDVL